MSPTPSSLRILIVEDNPGDAALIREHLRHLPALVPDVQEVARLADAGRQLAHGHFDVVLLDLNLPDASGTEAVEALVAAADGVPVVVLTGERDEELAQACVRAGAQDFLCKADISAVTVRRAIGFALSRSREATIQTLEQALARYDALSSASTRTSVTQNLAGVGPIRRSAPAEFERLRISYSSLLEVYLSQLVVQSPKPLASMSSVANRLGDLGGGPRDMIDLHVAALEALALGASGARARSLAVDGRLLALEMMGLLVEYYRVGITRRRSREVTG